MKMNANNILIIILNWNGWKDTIECLDSLLKINYQNYNIVLVENGSSNDSFIRLKDYIERNLALMPSNSLLSIINVCLDDRIDKILSYEDTISNIGLILIKNKLNCGFADGNNIAINFALNAGLNPDYFLLLNNDTTVSEEFLNELVTIAQSDIKIGFVGPKVYHYYNSCSGKNIISFAGGKINLWKGKSYHIGSGEVDLGQFNLVKDVDYVEGSCILIKTSVLRKIGLLDPNYFAYWEETDLCMKGIKAGYRALYAPKAVIWHKVSASVSASSNYKIKVYYLNKNRLWFEKRHANDIQYIVFILYLLFFDIWRSTLIALFYYRDLLRVRCLWRALLDGLREGDRT